jgi:hypothetical protein
MLGDTSQAQTRGSPSPPNVQVDGRRVTVTFEMPFMVGDACVTPRHGILTTVSRAPDVRIELSNDLSSATVHCGGAWYSADHTQMHGHSEFLPDMAALLSFWLQQPGDSYTDRRLEWLNRVFAGQPEALSALNARRIELKRAEIDASKKDLAETMLSSARRINELEAELSLSLTRTTGVQA